jgi:hypothetical protein
MTASKPFGILDDGQREGGKIAVIADIARHRRNRKGKNLTAESTWIGKGFYRRGGGATRPYLLSAVSSFNETAYFPLSSTVSVWP